MARYPSLREETERIVNTRMREQEQKSQGSADFAGGYTASLHEHESRRFHRFCKVRVIQLTV